VIEIQKSSYHKHYYPDEHSGICVVLHKGEKDEDFIKRFRKKFSKSGLAKELRDRMFFEKPSDKKRRKKAQSIRMIKREEEKLIEMRERYVRMKLKRKRQQAKERKKGDNYDQRTSRQDSSRVSENDKNRIRINNS
jgi:small subunit ribosomal protein S21